MLYTPLLLLTTTSTLTSNSSLSSITSKSAAPAWPQDSGRRAATRSRQLARPQPPGPRSPARSVPSPHLPAAIPRARGVPGAAPGAAPGAVPARRRAPPPAPSSCAGGARGPWRRRDQPLPHVRLLFLPGRAHSREEGRGEAEAAPLLPRRVQDRRPSPPPPRAPAVKTTTD